MRESNSFREYAAQESRLIFKRYVSPTASLTGSLCNRSHGLLYRYGQRSVQCLVLCLWKRVSRLSHQEGQTRAELGFYCPLQRTAEQGNRKTYYKCMFRLRSCYQVFLQQNCNGTKASAIAVDGVLTILHQPQLPEHGNLVVSLRICLSCRSAVDVLCLPCNLINSLLDCLVVIFCCPCRCCCG